MTDSDSGVRGGRLVDDEVDADLDERNLRKYAWYERCLIDWAA